MKTVTIKVRTVGQAFGCEAVVKYLNGRTAHTTDTFPYGFTSSAYDSALHEAERRGWKVVES